MFSLVLVFLGVVCGVVLRRGCIRSCVLVLFVLVCLLFPFGFCGFRVFLLSPVVVGGLLLLLWAGFPFLVGI